MFMRCINRKPTDEKNEKQLRLLQRWTLTNDGDGHRFLLPIEKLVEFEEWLENEGWEEDPGKYEAYRLEGGRLTFTDPTVD